MSLGKMLGHSQDVRKYEGWDGFILPTCRLGLEFEFEGVRRQILPDRQWAQLWTFHEERSIRDQGAEYVFTSPMFGKDAYEAIKSLMEYAKQEGWRSSLRTGIHVHIDARDLSVPQLQGMCLLYALFEPAIYRWVGDNRATNVFCLPWYAAEGGLRDATGVVRNAIAEQSRGLAQGTTRQAASLVNRYAGMNMNSLVEHGSIEFRQLKTTLDLERVVNWINIVQSIKRGAFLAPQCDGVLLQMVAEQGPRRIGHQLLGETFELLDHPDLERDVFEIGLVTANQIVQEGIESNPLDFSIPFPEGTNQGFRRFMETSASPLAGAPEVTVPPLEPPRPVGRGGRRTLGEVVLDDPDDHRAAAWSWDQFNLPEAALTLNQAPTPRMRREQPRALPPTTRARLQVEALMPRELPREWMPTPGMGDDPEFDDGAGEEP